MAKKILSFDTFNAEEHHERLNACINCVYELTCKTALPFPINLEQCCDKYMKSEFKRKE